MGKVIDIIRRVFLLCATVFCMYLVYHNTLSHTLSIDGTVHLLNKYSPTYYEVLSDNVGITTINGISNVFINMKQDGYSIYSMQEDNGSIDVSFIKEDYPSYRFYFEYPSCRITFLCSEYETSYNGLAYILERKE